MKHYKNLVDLIKTAARKYGTWEVFKDFIEMSAIAFSNAVDHSINRNSREEQYMQIVKRYEKKYLDLFSQMIAELTLAMEENPSDILGRIYCELELSNKWTGQFFTPDSICRMMAKMTLTDDMKRLIDEKGFVTVQEPAIGGGALIINLAMAMQEEKINYQQSMVVTGVDVDIKAIYMAYIQLSLLHIPAILIHGNSLSLEVHSKWYTPAYFMGGWAYKKQIEKEETETLLIVPPIEESVVVPFVKTEERQVIEFKTSKKQSAKIQKYESISLFG